MLVCLLALSYKAVGESLWCKVTLKEYGKRYVLELHILPVGNDLPLMFMGPNL